MPRDDVLERLEYAASNHVDTGTRDLLRDAVDEIKRCQEIETVGREIIAEGTGWSRFRALVGQKGE